MNNKTNNTTLANGTTPDADVDITTTKRRWKDCPFCEHSFYFKSESAWYCMKYRRFSRDGYCKGARYEQTTE